MASPVPPAPRRRRNTYFRPRFTLLILYIAALYFVYSLAVAAPTLLEHLAALPPDADPRDPMYVDRAAEATRAVLEGKPFWILMAAVGTVILGAWRGWLPGLREAAPD
ncbi:MAG: hypothetical protein OEP95_11645 [Myxococcales bacterium]|jgi:hypothetical protein|nr:hypothetical protein [Myxococcales bacterium]